MPSRKLRVAVLFGGKSAEHEVSLVSARAVMEGLNREKYDVVQVGITKSGRWLTAPNALDLLTSGESTKGSMNPLLPSPERREQGIDVVFPVLHGTFGEDGTVQGFLELADLPYVGSGVLSSAVGMDKIIQKQLFAAAGLPVVSFQWYESWEVKKNGSGIAAQIQKSFGYPVFVKPANMGSSIGITKAHNRKELIAGLREAVRFDRRVLVEDGVEGAREIEIAVLGNHSPKTSVAGEIIPSNEFYDYHAKYIDGKSDVRIPARITKRLSGQLRDFALRAFHAIDAAGMARVDFLLSRDGRRAYINEVNTIPGFTPISMYAKLWKASGVPFSKLLDRLIALARERHKEMHSLTRVKL